MLAVPTARQVLFASAVKSAVANCVQSGDCHWCTARGPLGAVDLRFSVAHAASPPPPLGGRRALLGGIQGSKAAPASAKFGYNQINDSVLYVPSTAPPRRTILKSNHVVGGVLLHTVRAKAATPGTRCERSGALLAGFCTGVPQISLEPYGVDAVFKAGSSLYDPSVNTSIFYSPKVSSTPSGEREHAQNARKTFANLATSGPHHTSTFLDSAMARLIG